MALALELNLERMDLLDADASPSNIAMSAKKIKIIDLISVRNKRLC